MKLGTVIASLLLSPCAPVQEPRPQPVPVVDSVVIPPEPEALPRFSACQKACQRLLALGCLGSDQTAGGLSCEQAFCEVSAGWDYSCMQRAASCDALNACNP